MRKICSTTIGAFALVSSNIAISATDSWSVNLVAPIVYHAQEENSNFTFGPVTIPRSAKITNVEFDLGLYANDATIQRFRICHGEHPPEFPKCTDYSTIRAGQTSIFNGLSPRAYFKITGYLYGGTYPFYPKHTNGLKVTYQY